MKTTKKQLTFEEAMSRLEEIVNLLENGGADLDKTLSLYEEGAKLAALCSAKLEKAEQTVEKIDEIKNIKADEPENDGE